MQDTGIGQQLWLAKNATCSTISKGCIAYTRNQHVKNSLQMQTTTQF